MSTAVRAIEVVQVKATADDDADVSHIVCHCTDDVIAACGLDCTEIPWVDDGEDLDCPLCYLAWPDDALVCPWGCGCDECGGPRA